MHGWCCILGVIAGVKRTGQMCSVLIASMRGLVVKLVLFLKRHVRAEGAVAFV